MSEVAKEATTVIPDIDTFANVISTWHAQQVATLEHMMTIPEDTQIRIGESPELITLSGEVHRAFILGVDLSLSYFSNLPFFTVPEEEEKSAEAV